MPDLDLYDRYTGTDLGLTTLVARNIAVATLCANLTNRQIADHLGLVQSALTPRINLTVPWKVDEIDQIAALIGLEPCRFLSTSPSSVARVLAAKRQALVALFRLNPNPSHDTMRTWLTDLYSADYAALVLPQNSMVAS